MKVLTLVVALAATVSVAEANEKQAAIGPAAGFVEKPGSQKGVFSFVNTQTELPRKEIEMVAKMVEKSLLIKTEIVDAKPGCPAELVKAARGAIGLVVVCDDKTPALLVAPEDGWAVVNVKKLDKFATPESRAKSFGDRCRRELLRGFCAVSGGCASTYPGNCISVTNLEELELAPEGIPYDKVEAARRFLKSRGYSPLYRTSYGKACREGWAPAPTNDAQRTVWNRIHALPSDPIKIKYDPKRDK